MPDELGATGWSDDIEAVREHLLEWYRENRREFPWRETSDPYPILVSEVMSQQTQLDRIVDPWEAFLDRWPSVEDLARADRSAVIRFWSNHRLGYNNRARYLHEAARQIVDEYDGIVPRTPPALQELKGVGPYTANAVASFAFDHDGAVVDTNVRRVLHRAFGIPDNDEAFQATANALVPPGGSDSWNNAIMELGGTICERQPRCDEEPCPWRERCTAYETGDFSAPDVPTQPAFEGSRRQLRGRVIRALGEYGEQSVDELGPRVRVDYTPDGEHGREWLVELLSDLEDDGLVEVADRDGSMVVSLAE